MATSNFLIFDENLQDIDTDVEYAAESQRLDGVTPGLATPKMHNKLYRQCSVMAYAIASVLVARGYSADDSDPANLIDSIQRAFAFSVNGNIPNASGAVTAVRPIDAWPVGSLFLTFSNTNPATLLGGGTWVQIKGKYLIAADTGYTVDGNTNYGAMSRSVPLLAHTHGFSISSSGAHTHSVSNITTTAAGGHSHAPGSMNIKGTFSGVGQYYGNVGGATLTGAFYRVNTSNNPSQGARVSNGSDAERDDYFGFEAARNWTGSTAAVSDHTHKVSVSISSSGAHTHSGTTGSQGTSSPTMDMRPLSIAVYMWRRTA